MPSSSHLLYHMKFGIFHLAAQKSHTKYPSLVHTEASMDVNVVRTTAKALTTLLLHRQTSKTPAYSAIRRAAIDLIGRGFPLWEPHIDVSQVMIGLFELCADIETRLRNDKGRNFSISAAKVKSHVHNP